MSERPRKGKVQPIGENSPPQPTSTASASKPQDSPPRNITFFQRIARIPAADWGTRAKIKVYRLAPIIDRLRGSENKYITVYQEPITEEKLKIDHGSGRYRLYLNYKEPAGTDKELDSVELDVMDLNFPPKVPLSEWVDDPRNKQWAWAKNAITASQPPAPTPPDVLSAAYGQVVNIQEREAARLASVTPAKSSFGELTDMAAALKTLMPPATDNTMLTTVVTLLQTQIAASNAEAQQLRAQVFELIKAKAEGKEERTNALDVVKEFIDNADTLLPKIKGLIGSTTDGIATVAHGRPRPWYQELALATLPQLVQAGTPLLQGLAMKAIQPQQPVYQPNGNGQPQAQLPAGAPQSATPMNAAGQKLQTFLMANIGPLQRDFRAYLEGQKDDDGGPLNGWHFADWVYENHDQYAQPGQGVLDAARMLGAGNMLAIFKQQPFWSLIAQHEGKVEEFLNQVLKYDPPPPEGSGEDDGPTDLTIAGGAHAD